MITDFYDKVVINIHYEGGGLVDQESLFQIHRKQIHIL